MYSASQVDLATVDCLFDDQLIIELANLSMYPLNDLDVFGSFAQDASANIVNAGTSCLYGYQSLSLIVALMYLNTCLTNAKCCSVGFELNELSIDMVKVRSGRVLTTK